MNSSDKYDVSGNIEAQFVDADEEILVNKLLITDLEELQIHEEESLAAAYEKLLNEVRVDTAMSVELIRYIHELVFGELFEWAGRWRTVVISKPGAIWPHRNSWIRRCRRLRRMSFPNTHPRRSRATKTFAERQPRFRVSFFRFIHSAKETHARSN